MLKICKPVIIECTVPKNPFKFNKFRIRFLSLFRIYNYDTETLQVFLACYFCSNFRVFIISCFRLWCLSSLLNAYLRSHRSQWYGVGSCWAFIWRIRSECRTNFSLQSVHMHFIFGWLCLTRWWNFNPNWCLYDFRQSSHLNFFSPLWLRSWSFNCPLVVKFFLQMLHL